MMQQKDNVELLNYIYQNSEMGQLSIDQLLGIVEEQKVQGYLIEQKNEYDAINQEAVQRLRETGHKEEDISRMAKMSSSMSITGKTLRDKSPSHIAEMMMKGSNMGIIDITKKMKEHAHADMDTIKLAHRLQELEESSMEHWKRFLQ